MGQKLVSGWPGPCFWSQCLRLGTSTGEVFVLQRHQAQGQADPEMQHVLWLWQAQVGAGWQWVRGRLSFSFLSGHCEAERIMVTHLYLTAAT